SAAAEQGVRREKRERPQARERAARRASTAARNVKDAGLPKILAGARQRRAQESAGKADGTHAARVSAAQARLDEAEQGLRDEQRIVLELPGTRVPAGRTVFAGEGIRVRDLFAGRGVDLTIRRPERIARTGPNGAGNAHLMPVGQGHL